MSNLNQDQFGLFPENHPAMNPLEPHQMNMEQFRDLPGAWHHGTYKDKMPEYQTSAQSAGIHLGTMKAAEDIIDSHGPRINDARMRRVSSPGAPADIHTRRLEPDVHLRKGTDQGDNWSDRYRYADAADAGDFAEKYTNEVEDKGSTSIRVPRAAGYLVSHRQSVDSALRAGKNVNPQALALRSQLDTPMQHQVAPRPVPRLDSLLPITLKATTGGGLKEQGLLGQYDPSKTRGEKGPVPATTFVTTQAEATKMTESRMWYQKHR